MTSRFVGLPCCLTIICDNVFLPTPAKYECQAPKIWVQRDQPVSCRVFAIARVAEVKTLRIRLFHMYIRNDDTTCEIEGKFNM